MKLPNIRNTFKDRKTNVTYHVMAYRALSPDELIQSIRVYLAQEKSKPKPGQTIAFDTTIGHDQ